MNENQITCEICRDLMPLVKDGVASTDSETAVTQHVKDCRECALLYDGKSVPSIPASESPRALLRVKRRLGGVYTILMMFGIYFGLSLTASEDLFFNCLIMPIVGVFGYLVFRWKALFAVPVLLLAVMFVMDGLGLLAERMGFAGVLVWTLILIPFALAGVIIVMFLRFAFGKFNGGSEYERSGENEC